ncbi:hypothetical protein IIA79_04460 [bacterium]|nr:hypothetical protein [bacterium]
MISTIISRLKKSKQRVDVCDAAGNMTTGVVSGWDDALFMVRRDDEADIIFPINAFASITVEGGMEKAHLPHTEQ